MVIKAKFKNQGDLQKINDVLQVFENQQKQINKNDWSTNKKEQYKELMKQRAGSLER